MHRGTNEILRTLDTLQEKDLNALVDANILVAQDHGTYFDLIDETCLFHLLYGTLIGLKNEGKRATIESMMQRIRGYGITLISEGRVRISEVCICAFLEKYPSCRQEGN